MGNDIIIAGALFGTFVIALLVFVTWAFRK